MTIAHDPPFLAAGGAMGRAIAAHDWSVGPLGPLPSWSGPLRTAVGIMLESRHPMLIWWGPDLTLLYNDAFVPLLGDKHPRALGSAGREAYSEIWSTIGPMLRTVLDRGEATWVDDQQLMMNRRGYVEETYWTYSFSPVRDGDGTVRGVFTATNDTTARVIAARRLDTLRALGNVSAVNIDEVTRGALDALAASRVDVPFAAVYLCVPDGGPAQLSGSYGIDAAFDGPDGVVEQALRQGAAVTAAGLRTAFPEAFAAAPEAAGDAPDVAVALPLSGSGEDEHPGVLVLGTSPYRPLDEDYRSFLELVAGQVSAAVADARAYEAERRRAEALAELDRAKTEFFTGVSHDFRTPLTLIMGPVAELRADATTDPQLSRYREALETVHRNGLRLRRMVDSLLEFSRLQDGHARGSYRPVDLAAATADLASLFRSAVTAAGLEYSVDCPDLGEPVYVDPAMWEQVVLNLLSNALKYTLAGRIGVELRRVGREAVLRVTDTGSGISSEHLPRVFERFHRADATAARSHEGSGIGLALVDQMVALHGGRVDVESEPGRGSTFTVRMPLGRAHLPAGSIGDPPAHFSPRPPATTAGRRTDRAAAFLAEAGRWLPDDDTGSTGPPAPATAGHVLVADDNADMRAYLRRLLAAEWDVQTVADGAAALAAARARPPDLVVSDVMMPRLDGLELVTALRADQRTAHVGVLLLSARAGTESSVEGLATGADDYLVKPFVAAELLARVRAQVQLSRGRRAGAQEQLERSEAAFRLLAEQADDIIGRHDLDGTWRYVSPSMQRTAGHDPAALVGTHPLDLVHPDDRDGVTDAFDRIDEDEPHATFTVRLGHVDGRWLWVEVRVRRVRGARTGEPELHTATRDVTDRLLAEQELARFRTLVQTGGDFIAVAGTDGLGLYLNPAARRLVGIEDHRPVGEVRMVDLVAPADRDRFVTDVLAAVERDGSWVGDLDLVDAAGTVIPTAQVMQAHRDPTGRLEFVSTVARDLRTTRVVEQQRQAAAADAAARRVADAAAARLRAMVDGLAAIVAEGEWDAQRRTVWFTFITERAEELLGYRPDHLLGDATAWLEMIHPDDRADAARTTVHGIEAGLDHDTTYRAVAIDGRIVWLHQVVHVVCDADGTPVRVQALAVDVTEQKRAERAAELLAESGRLVNAEGSAEDRLAALARLVMRDFGDAAVVSLIGHDGLVRRAAVALDDPDRERALLRLAPTNLPPDLIELLAAGRPVHLPVTDELNRAAAVDEADAAARIALGVRSVLAVPLLASGHAVGVLGFVNYTDRRHYDRRDLELAEELGRRASQMVQADRQRKRERHTRQINADLASAATVAEAAQRLVHRISDALGAAAASVYLVVEADRSIRQVYLSGYAQDVASRYAVIRIDDPVPIARAVRTGEPVWLRDRAEWHREFPDLLPAAEAGDRHAAATLPLLVAGRVVGAIGLSFSTPRTFHPDEQAFAEAMLAQAAPAFERAATADERRQIAETLQTSLLPSELPALDRLGLAARYQPGAHGTTAGGDWYDVLPLAGDQVCLVVGDVVGQGARAAAMMGQLRSALSAYLLEGHGPVDALERLDLFAARVPGAMGSTVACLVLDTVTGAVTWARAGHLPPLVTGLGGPRYLEGAEGTVLGVRGRDPFVAGSATLEPGESVVLYTDGLVERRGEIVDEGLGRLADAAARGHRLGPTAMACSLLDTVATAGPADDIAVVVARLLPSPLHRILPADPAQLRGLRVDAHAWATAAGLPETVEYDLQLALGEAAANAVEHAYRELPVGTVAIDLCLDERGAVHAAVRDHGVWRPRPADPGRRGRGLDLIRDLSTTMETEKGDDGTTVRFVVSPQSSEPATATSPDPSRPDPVPPSGGTRLDVSADGSRLVIVGDLDLAGVRAVTPGLLSRLNAGGPTVLDLRGSSYMASAGVALLIEAAETSDRNGIRLRVLVPERSNIRRILEISGADGVVEIAS